MLLKDFHIIIGIGVIIVLSAGTVLGTIKFAIPFLKESLTQLAVRLDELEDKMPQLCQKGDLDKVDERFTNSLKAHQNTCQRAVCNRIDELRSDLRSMDEKREAAKNNVIRKDVFDQYKLETSEQVKNIQYKIDSQVQLLARLDERVLLMLQVLQSKEVPDPTGLKSPS